PLELLARLEPELVREQAAGRAVDLERLRLAARPVEGEHEPAAQPLLERMLGDERLELADELGVAAEREVGLDPLEQRRQAKLVQALGLAACEPLEAKVGQGRATPELERLSPELRGPPRLPLHPRRPGQALKLVH